MCMYSSLNHSVQQSTWSTACRCKIIECALQIRLHFWYNYIIKNYSKNKYETRWWSMKRRKWCRVEYLYHSFFFPEHINKSRVANRQFSVSLRLKFTCISYAHHRECKWMANVLFFILFFLIMSHILISTVDLNEWCRFSFFSQVDESCCRCHCWNESLNWNTVDAVEILWKKRNIVWFISHHVSILNL